MPRKPKVVERKLGRHKAVGIAYHDDNKIEIDPRQTPRDFLDTLLHERLHLLCPDMSEKEVARISKGLTQGLWDMNFRRVNNQ